jgi:EAL and modified HD-GYP domain-containing signal transduction protein
VTPFSPNKSGSKCGIECLKSDSISKLVATPGGCVAETNYLLGRQPILNRNEDLVAYELLFRSAGSITADVTDASHATASVIINTLTAFGIEEILGNHKGFINMELELLMGDSLNILPKEQVVIELLETLHVTPALVERCRFLKESGFTLALDDHEYDPFYHDLYSIVDIVKVDLMMSPPERLTAMVSKFAGYPLILLAEKVESQDEFKTCLDLGFELFQGYYFAKPSIMEKKSMGESGATLLKLMRLLGEDSEQAEIENTFRGDPDLTYKLLLLVNSVGTGVRSKISTVGHAIMVLGRQQIKRWVQLAMFASNDRRGMENPLVDLAAVRAGFMEQMAACHCTLKRHRDSPEKAYMTGILSILDRVYDISMDEVIQRLNLSDDIRDALAARQGVFGELLQVAEILEGDDYSELGRHLEKMGISFENALLSQKKAFAWRKGMV